MSDDIVSGPHDIEIMVKKYGSIYKKYRLQHRLVNDQVIYHGVYDSITNNLIQLQCVVTYLDQRGGDKTMVINSGKIARYGADVLASLDIPVPDDIMDKMHHMWNKDIVTMMPTADEMAARARSWTDKVLNGRGY